MAPATMHARFTNLAWQVDRDEDLLAVAATGVDVLYGVEARDRANDPIDVAAVLGDGWVVHQRLDNAETAGSFIAIRRVALPAGATAEVRRWVKIADGHKGTRLRTGLQDRYLLDVEVTTLGRRPLHLVVFHLPLLRTGKQGSAAKVVHAHLAAIRARGEAFVAAADVNMRPARFASGRYSWRGVTRWGFFTGGASFGDLAVDRSVTRGGTTKRLTDSPLLTVPYTDLTPAPAPTPAPKPVPPKEAPVAKLPSNLPQILKDAGLKVAVHPGWESRGRPGAFAPVGVLAHHTATRKSSSDSNVVRLLVDGRSDLPGPLCQLGLARDGTVHVIAAGRANHGGKARSSGTVAEGDANALYIGIEAFNDGVGEKWPAAQYDAYVKLAAALCEKVTGNSAETVRGHKETSVTGKIDPTFPMDAFRSRVAALLAGKTETPGRVQPRATNVQALRRDVLAALKKHGSEIPANRISARTWVRALTALAKGGPKS